MKNSRIRIPLLVVLNFVFIGCISKPSKIEQTFQVINFGRNFSEFSQNSRDADEKQAFSAWIKFVESSDPAFFSQVIGDSSENPNWKQDYEKSFDRTLPYLRKYEAQIWSEFEQFDHKLSSAIKTFSAIFPDFNISDVPIYGAPSLMKFNGQGAEVDKKSVLAFGLDTVVILKNEPNIIPKTHFISNSDVLYAHEIFHIYHNKKQGFSEDKLLKTGQLINAVWNEGLATYASQIVNPEASDSELLMDGNLAKECDKNSDKMVKKFSSIAHHEFGNTTGRDLYRDWFLLSSKNESLPIRTGYCVGLVLARRVAKQFSLSEMASWKFEDINDRLAPFLLE